ncbi:MAG: alpha/beta fold hydrolase [Novosphingobium sp.]
MIRLLAGLTAAATLAVPEIAPAASKTPANPIVFPDKFDPLGTPVQSLVTDKGRKVHFTDTGEAGWRTMVFIGGAGTSARAPELVGFLDTMRRRLKIRIIAVERNGLGDTAFDPTWGFDDYVSEVRQVLAHLKVGRFSLAAISGGGAYAGHVLAAMPERIDSWHMLAAVSTAPRNRQQCAADAATLAQALAPQVGAPRVWWDMPKDGVSAKVRGFADRAADEGAHAFFIAGQMGDPRGMAAESRRFCDPPADVSAFKAPAYFYYGEADPLVPPSHGEYWAAKVKGMVTFRRYPAEGHDVQYRHWDQLLLDVAGYGSSTLVCDSGRAHLVKGMVDPNRLSPGRSLGVCAWQGGGK